MNTVKKTGGFTLVELIIVIAILAILSSVAVAGYSSYIKKANDSAAETFMDNAVTHVVLANAENGGITSITFQKTNAGVVVTVTADNLAGKFEANLEEAYGVAVTVTDNATGTADTATFTVTNAPAAFANSKYNESGKMGKWENGVISQVAVAG